MAKGQLKYRNPNYVEGGDEPKWISLGSSGSSSGDTAKQYETVNVSISASNASNITADVTVNGETKSVTSGSSVLFEVEYGTEYTIEVSDVEGFAKPEVLTFTAEQSIRNIELEFKYILITTIRIDQTITDPATMITRVVDNGGIEAIRANSHRYTGVLNEDGVMALKQLDDNDGTKYADGTSATLTALGTDVWMKLPLFYWRCIEHDTDVWEFSVAYGGNPDGTYKEWDGKDLIGVYEAYNSSDMTYSVSGVESSYASQSNFKDFSRSRGLGFSVVKWKHHCMMAMLYYTQYGHTNCQIKIGVGTASEKSTGATNSLCMVDTVADDNGNSNSINFWGLENWWGNKFEWIDDVIVDINYEFIVGNDDETTRLVGTHLQSNGHIKTMLFGENIDLLPLSIGASSDTGFCDYSTYSENHSEPRVVLRSYDDNSVDGGVVSINAGYMASVGNSNHGSRLCFYGDYIIDNN